MLLFSDHYVLGLINNIKNPPIYTIAVGAECVGDSNYYFDNSSRPSAYLFQYTISGYGTIEFGGNIYRVGPGQGFFLKMSGSSKYYFDDKKEKEPWHFLYIIVNGERAEDYYFHVTESYGHIYNLPDTSSSVSVLYEIYRMAKQQEIDDSFTSERLAFDFVCRLCSDCANNEAKYIRIVRDAIDIIKSDYATLGGISEIAERLGVTQSYLSRIFTEQTGTNPILYLTKVRLQNAMNLLVQTSLSIEDIAQKCGFSCGNYLCKIFSKYIRTSPLKYRNRMQQMQFHSQRSIRDTDKNS